MFLFFMLPYKKMSRYFPHTPTFIIEPIKKGIEFFLLYADKVFIFCEYGSSTPSSIAK